MNLSESNGSRPVKSSTQVLQQRLIEGDSDALGTLLMSSRERLLTAIRFRMDRRLAGRIDPADVVQDAFLEATERIEEYRSQQVSFFVWLRFLTMQRLVTLHRRHLGARARSVSLEVSIFGGSLPEASSADLAARLIGRLTTPSQAFTKLEAKIRLEAAFSEMDPTDRDVLALRYFEQLSNSETADTLAISESAASNRYVRALKRLRKLMEAQ